MDWRCRAVLSSTPLLQASSPTATLLSYPDTCPISSSTNPLAFCQILCFLSLSVLERGDGGGKAGTNSRGRNMLHMFLYHYLPIDLLRQSPSHSATDSHSFPMCKEFLAGPPLLWWPDKIFALGPKPSPGDRCNYPTDSCLTPQLISSRMSFRVPSSLHTTSPHTCLRSFLALRSFALLNFAYANRYDGTHTPHSACHFEDVSTLIVITCSGLKYPNCDAAW